MEVQEIKFDTLGGLSDEQFFAFCQANKQLKFERSAEGEIFIMGLTGSETGTRNANIIIYLGIWNLKYKSGRIFDSSTGFKLPNTAVRSPDAAFITYERWNALSESEQKRFAPICPDFVIELMSQSDHLPNLQAKMQEWIKNGCRLAWLINADTLEVHIYRADSSVTLVQGADSVLFGEDVLPNFSLTLGEISL
ncbi:MAG: Uma2 family endonuclease [Candidatus Kapaibacterium sp.]|nr:MAG: Uma2 family endonuclease [Candidatus Kapabacteria bacterium]